MSTTAAVASRPSENTEPLLRGLFIVVGVLSLIYLIGYTVYNKVGQGANNSGFCLVTTAETASIDCESGASIAAKVTSDDGKTALAGLKQGSIIKRPSDGAMIAIGSAKDIGISRVCPGYLCDLAGVAAGLVAAFIYCGIVTKCVCPWHGFKKLVVGEDRRPSNSKTQVTLWLGVLLVAFVGTAYLRWISGMSWSNAVDIGISSELLTLAGISVATAGASKAVTANRAEGGAKSEPEEGGRFLDLFTNDKKDLDPADSLMFLATLALTGFFIASVWSLWRDLPLSAHLDLPNPADLTSLAFGGSLGAYLAKKIINEVGTS